MSIQKESKTLVCPIYLSDLQKDNPALYRYILAMMASRSDKFKRPICKTRVTVGPQSSSLITAKPEGIV